LLVSVSRWKRVVGPTAAQLSPNGLVHILKGYCTIADQTVRSNFSWNVQKSWSVRLKFVPNYDAWMLVHWACFTRDGSLPSRLGVFRAFHCCHDLCSYQPAGWFYCEIYARCSLRRWTCLSFSQLGWVDVATGCDWEKLDQFSKWCALCNERRRNLRTRS